MKRYIIIAICIIAAGTLGCGQKNETLKKTGDSADVLTLSSGMAENAVKGRELICLTGDEEDAKKTAQLYGIELVEFANGVASFHTEEEPAEVIKRGMDNGWPELSVNSYNSQF